MPDPFDLIVIGTGVAASTVAKKCRSAGWSVAVVDKRPYGGTCALRGCDAKKVLVGAAQAVDAVRRLQSKGVECAELGIRWSDLIRFKRSFTEPVPRQREQSLGQAGIFTYHGSARFTGSHTVQVGSTELQGRRIYIAAGATPMDLGIPGQEHLTTSDQFLDLDTLPERVLFIGGGYISFEFAHVAARAGARVTLVHMDDRPLPQFDPDLVSMLVERTRQLGVDIRLDTTAQAIEPIGEGGGLAVIASGPGGAPIRFEADLVVHGAGRVPDLDELNLDTAGIQRDRGGVVVNEYMQSVSNPAVYAAGDAAAGGPPLTPVAALQARVVARNLLDGNRHAIEYPPIPAVVFTEPPLASVGLSEREAREQGHEVRAERTSDWYSSRRVNERFSGFKLLLNRRSGRVLGAHLLGPYADEQINLFALAMSAGLTTRELTRAVFAYPTAASDVDSML